MEAEIFCFISFKVQKEVILNDEITKDCSMKLKGLSDGTG
jgi:hypothetical protein